MDTVPQLTREILARMTPEAIDAARKAGHLAELMGQPAPYATDGSAGSMSREDFLALDRAGRLAALDSGAFDPTTDHTATTEENHR